VEPASERPIVGGAEATGIGERITRYWLLRGGTAEPQQNAVETLLRLVALAG